MKKSVKLLSVIMAVVMLVSAVAVFAYIPEGYVELAEDEDPVMCSKKYDMPLGFIFDGEYDKINYGYTFEYADNGGYYIRYYSTSNCLYVSDGILYEGSYAYATGKVSKLPVVDTAQVWYYDCGYIYTDVTEEKTVTALSGFFSLFTRFIPNNYVSTTRYYLAYDEDYDEITVSTLPVDRVSIIRYATDSEIDAERIYHECKVTVDVQQTASVSSFLSWLMGGTRGNVYSDQYTMTISVDMDYTVPYSVSYCIVNTYSGIMGQSQSLKVTETFGFQEKYIRYRQELIEKYKSGEYDENDLAEIYASQYTFTDYYGVASFTKSSDSDWPMIIVKVNYLDEEGDNCSLQYCRYDSELGCYVTVPFTVILDD